MQIQAAAQLFNQDQVANLLQLKYKKVLLTFFDKDGTFEPLKKASVVETKIANKTRFLKLFSTRAEHHWTKISEEIKELK